MLNLRQNFTEKWLFCKNGKRQRVEGFACLVVSPLDFESITICQFPSQTVTRTNHHFLLFPNVHIFDTANPIKASVLLTLSLSLHHFYQLIPLSPPQQNLFSPFLPTKLFWVINAFCSYQLLRTWVSALYFYVIYQRFLDINRFGILGFCSLVFPIVFRYIGVVLLQVYSVLLRFNELLGLFEFRASVLSI